MKSIFLTLGDGLPRNLALLDLTVVLTYINYRELTIIGWLVLLGISINPLSVVMGIVVYLKLKPSRWLGVNLYNVDWNLNLKTLFWNINYYDSISTLASEVDNSKRTLPKTLLLYFDIGSS